MELETSLLPGSATTCLASSRLQESAFLAEERGFVLVFVFVAVLGISPLPDNVSTSLSSALFFFQASIDSRAFVLAHCRLGEISGCAAFTTIGTSSSDMGCAFFSFVIPFTSSISSDSLLLCLLWRDPIGLNQSLSLSVLLFRSDISRFLFACDAVSSKLSSEVLQRDILVTLWD